MDIMQAKKLFAPPEKPDASRQHLIMMVNKSFEALAMELCELTPNSPILSDMVKELHKIRLQVVFDIEHAPVKKAKKDEAPTKPEKPAKPAKGAKNPPAEKPATPTPPPEDNDEGDQDLDNQNNNDEMEGFE